MSNLDAVSVVLLVIGALMILGVVPFYFLYLRYWRSFRVMQMQSKSLPTGKTSAWKRVISPLRGDSKFTTSTESAKALTSIRQITSLEMISKQPEMSNNSMSISYNKSNNQGSKSELKGISTESKINSSIVRYDERENSGIEASKSSSSRRGKNKSSHKASVEKSLNEDEISSPEKSPGSPSARNGQKVFVIKDDEDENAPRMWQMKQPKLQTIEDSRSNASVSSMGSNNVPNPKIQIPSSNPNIIRK